MSHRQLHTLFISAATLLLPALALAQISTTDRLIQQHAQPDEYYFFDAERKQVVDYKTERVVRICTGESKHLVPLKVTYDGETTTIRSGDCVRVEAKEVYLEPQKRLDPNWVIMADVDTMPS